MIFLLKELIIQNSSDNHQPIFFQLTSQLKALLKNAAEKARCHKFVQDYAKTQTQIRGTVLANLTFLAYLIQVAVQNTWKQFKIVEAKVVNVELRFAVILSIKHTFQNNLRPLIFAFFNYRQRHSRKGCVKQYFH